MRKRVWLYGRVADGSSEGWELKGQMEFLRCWAAENGCTVAGETAEVGIGIRAERPGLAEVAQAVRNKKMDAVVVKDMGRLMRDYIAGTKYIYFLQAEGVELVSINDGPCINMIHTLAGCFKV